MLELTKLEKRVAEKKAELMNHLRNRVLDRAEWCREDITILSKRVRVLKVERKTDLRTRSAAYQRKRHAKGRAEYLASPEFVKDTEAAWKRAFDRKEQRAARKAQRLAQSAEREARIAAMTPEARRDFFKAERWKNAVELKGVAETKAYSEHLRAKAAQERRARRVEGLKLAKEQRDKLIAEYEAEQREARTQKAQSLNTDPQDPHSPIPLLIPSATLANEPS